MDRVDCNLKRENHNHVVSSRKDTGEPSAKKQKYAIHQEKRNVHALKNRLLKRCEEINAKTFENYSILVTCEVTILNKNGDGVDYGKAGEKSRTEQERFKFPSS